jgi:hypothetical protein
VAYLLDREGMTPEALLARPIEQAEVEGRLRGL